MLFITSGALAQDNTPDIPLGPGDPDFTTSGDSTTSGENSPNILANGFDGTITVRAGDTLTSTGNTDSLSGTFPSGGIIAQDTGNQSATITIVNMGTINASGTDAAPIKVTDIENVDITNSGMVTGQSNTDSAISIANATSGTLTNDGFISNASTRGAIAVSNTTIDIINSISGTIDTTGTDSDGIQVFNSDSTNVLNAGSITSASGGGIFLDQSTNLTVHNQTGGSITVTGANEAGIQAVRNDDIEIINDGNITTMNDSSIGILTFFFTGGTIRNGETGVISTSGDFSTGIAGLPGPVTLIENAGIINTNGNDAGGILLQSNVDSTITQESGGTITTTGDRSSGIGNFGTTSLSSTIDHHGTVNVSGAESHGITVQGFDSVVTTNHTGGALNVSGASGNGIHVVGGNSTTIQNDGDITVTGANGIGLNIDGLSNGSQTTNSATGVITSSSTGGEGVVYTATSGDNILTNAGTISGTVNAVRGGDSNETIDNSGTLTGNVTLGGGVDSISNSGTINGDVDLGDGDDSFTHLAGSSETAVDGGAGTDIATFTISGADAAETVDASAFTNIETADHSAGGDLTLTNTVSFDTVVVGTNSTLRLQAADAASVTTTLDAGSVLGIDSASTLANPNDNGIAVQAIGDGVTIDNQGTVSATGAGGTAISLFGGTNAITNGGTISSTDIAISGAAGDDDLSNDGSISGDVNLADGNDVITNTGSISGNIDLGDGTNSISNDGTLSSTGITVASGGGNDTLTNNGSITGGINLAAGNDVIVNGRTIDGSVDLGDGDDSFTHLAGSSETAVDGGAGTDIATFTISGADAAEAIDASTFTNIETADHSAGGDLTLTNTVSFDTVVVGTNSTLRLQAADAASVTTTLDTGSVLEVDSASTLANPNTNGVAVQAVGDGVAITNQGAISASSTGGTAIALSGGSNTITNSGVISGTGSSITGGSGADTIDNSGVITGDAQLGAGDDRVTLTAAAMFNGAIDFGDGDDTLVVEVAEGDSKTIDRVAFDPFNNLETFEKTGAGSVFIDAATTATARDSFIRAGLFQVDGIYNSNVFIDAATALQGTGQIGGDVTVSGQYSAGVGLGQVTIDGDLTLDGNSVFIVDLNLDDADLSFVGGGATFQNGVLVVMPDGVVVTADTLPFRHEIVRTQDGVTQSFSDIDAGGLGRAVVFVEGNSLFIEIIPALGDGEIYTAVPSLATTGALTVIDALNGQLIDRRGVENGRVDLWATSLNDFSRYHGDVFTDTSDYHVDVHGVMAGLGYGLTDNWTVGAFTGYQNLDQDFSNLAASVDGDNIFFGLYTIGNFGRFNLNGALAYHATDLYSTRSPGNGSTANASFDADVFTAHGRVGYELFSSDAFVFEPYAGLAYITIDRQGFEERGAGSANLEVFGDKTRFAYLDLGARIEGGLFGGSLIPHISAAWRYDLLDENNSVTQRFATGGSSFSIAGADLERSRLNASAGLLAYLSESFSVYATYDGEFGNALTSHGVRAGISYKF